MGGNKLPLTPLEYSELFGEKDPDRAEQLLPLPLVSRNESWARECYQTATGDIFTGLLKFSGKTFKPVGFCKIPGVKPTSRVPVTYLNVSENLLYVWYCGSIYVFDADNCNLVETIPFDKYSYRDGSVPEWSDLDWPDLGDEYKKFYKGCYGSKLLYADAEEIFISNEHYKIHLTRILREEKKAVRMAVVYGDISRMHRDKPVFLTSVVPAQAFPYEGPISRYDAVSGVWDNSSWKYTPWVFSFGLKRILDGRISDDKEVTALLVETKNRFEAKEAENEVWLCHTNTKKVYARIPADDIVGFDGPKLPWVTDGYPDSIEFKCIDITTGQVTDKWNSPFKLADKFFPNQPSYILSFRMLDGKILFGDSSTVAALDLHAKTFSPHCFTDLSTEPGSNVASCYSRNEEVFYMLSRAFLLAYDPSTNTYCTKSLEIWKDDVFQFFQTHPEDGTICLVGKKWKDSEQKYV
ncbi:MAG: hypothetical protein U5N86_08005 [Planctomycetota bacterium]|nr:hypothetical protein [Planctomycetota bacterium]